MSKVYLGIIAALFIGIATIVGAELAKQLHPIILIIFAYLLSVIFLFPLSFLLKEKLQFKELIKNKKEFLMIVLGMSIIGTLILTFGFSLTPAVHAIFLLRTEPIFVLVFSYFLLKEKITKKKFVLVTMLIIGSFLLITSGELKQFTSIHLGDLLVTLSMGIFAYTYIASKKIMEKINSTTLTLSANLVAGILLFPIILFLTKDLANFTLTNFYYLLTYTLLFFVFGLYFFFKSLKYIKPWIVSCLLTLGLTVGVVFALIWLKDTLTITQWIGGTILLISSYFISKES